MPSHIVFFCTGNICRSPVAEVLAQQMFGDDKLRFGSAGLKAAPGVRASAHACAYVAEHGLDLAGHRSRPLTRASSRGVAWLIGMTRSHAVLARGRLDPCGSRIGVLGAPGYDICCGEPTPAVEEVADPYGQAGEAYIAMGEQVCRLLGAWRDVFAELVSSGG